MYPNGTALNSKEVEKMLDNNDYYLGLLNLGLMYVVSTSRFKFLSSFTLLVNPTVFSVTVYAHTSWYLMTKTNLK